ncbi:MAG: T9SS type A sorting domain-containing protein [Chlorobi bacterium]|nr:T9SS type A sorting domain-containing protein [Chlorobiota bacterium]
MKDLGGYHDRPPVVIAPPDTVILPYLQSPTESSIYVCWHASISPESVVEYGTTESLGNSASGDVYIWEDSTTWHWVKLTNLEPETVYYYRAVSDTMRSDVYKFKTPPRKGQKTGHIRFAIIGDTRTYPDQFTNVVSSIREKVTEIYGDPDIENNLNLILSNGDIVTYGPTLSQYKAEWFEPLSGITANVPMMVSIGDHEHDADNYYNYMKYEDFAGPQGERYYSFQYGRVLFIAVHSIFHTEEQLQWLDNLLQTAEADSTIDWVIAYTHRPGHSEIWPDGNEKYVQDNVIPIMSKYSKADILTYGHSHAYERGQVNDVSLRLLENGGGGAELDRWREYPNQTDYPEIQKTYDYWSYTIIDIDVENKRYDGAMYAIGLDEIEFDNIRVDQFFRDKKNETPPSKPEVIEPANNSEVSQPITLHATEYNGTYEILSSQFQVTAQQGNYTNLLVDNKRDFENIYLDTGAPNFIPIDKNAGIDLTQCSLEDNNLQIGKSYWWRVRYRDKNLQWSSWSEEYSFTVTIKTDVEDNPGVIKESNLYNNYPNPFNPSTIIKFDVAKEGKVTLRIYTVEGKLVTELMNDEIKSGSYSVTWNGTDSFDRKMSSGIYFYKLQTTDYQKIGKAILIK